MNRGGRIGDGNRFRRSVGKGDGLAVFCHRSSVGDEFLISGKCVRFADEMGGCKNVGERKESVLGGMDRVKCRA
jgi:hypothetical protein